MELNKQNIIKIIKTAAVIILFYVGLQNLSAVMGGLRFLYRLVAPFVVGASIAFILNVPMRAIERLLFEKIEKKKGGRIAVARPLSLIITVILVGGVIFIVMFIIIPEIGKTFKMIIDQAIPFFQKVQNWLIESFEEYPDIESWLLSIKIDDWKGIGEKVFEFVKDGMGSIVNSTVSVVSTIGSGVVSAVLAFIFSIYILLQKERLGRQAKQLLYAFCKEKRADQIIGIAKLSEGTFSKFLSGQCLEALILGTMFVIAMSIFRFPYAVMIGVLIAFTALIPVVGAFIGCGIGAFLILIVDPSQAFWFVVMFVIIQQIEGNLVYPHVVGNSVGLPSIWVLFAVTVGGNMLGVAGMLIFIPGFSVLYTMLSELVIKRLRDREIAKEKWALPYSEKLPGRGGIKKERRQPKEPKKLQEPKKGKGRKKSEEQKKSEEHETK